MTVHPWHNRPSRPAPDVSHPVVADEPKPAAPRETGAEWLAQVECELAPDEIEGLFRLLATIDDKRLLELVQLAPDVAARLLRQQLQQENERIET